MYTTCTISSETTRLRDYVELCPIGVHTLNRGYPVPEIDIALRRRDAFEDSARRTYGEMATNYQNAAAAIWVFDPQDRKARPRICRIANVIDCTRRKRAGSYIEFHQPDDCKCASRRARSTGCGPEAPASRRNATAERTMSPNLNCGEVSGQRIVRTTRINGENATGRGYADSIPAKCCACSTWNHVAKSEQYKRQGEQHYKPKTRFHNAPPNQGIAERQPPPKYFLPKATPGN